MIAAVIPAKNEASRIPKVLNMLGSLPIQLIIPVINGSTDTTTDVVINIINLLKVPSFVISTTKPLGHDVPRAVGAMVAWDNKAEYVLFIDGDMDGNLKDSICTLISNTVTNDLDMSLTDCYFDHGPENTLAELVTYFRRKLNDKIGLSKILDDASPSHGPHMISRKFMNSVPIKELAVPPVSLTLAAKNQLKIGIGARLPNLNLGNQYRDSEHACSISKTIIGDCIEAMNLFDGKNRSRSLGSRKFTGYDPERNRELLLSFLNKFNK